MRSSTSASIPLDLATDDERVAFRTSRCGEAFGWTWLGIVAPARVEHIQEEEPSRTASRQRQRLLEDFISASGEW